MSVSFPPLHRVRAGRRLLLVFGVAIVAPGLALGALGIKALLQESRISQRQIQETLAAAAEKAAAHLESELKEWQQAADEIARSGVTDPSLWPERVRHAVTGGGAVVLIGLRDRLQVIPAANLLYDLSQPAADNDVALAPSPQRTKVEAVELVEKRYDAAAALYEKRLAEAKPAERAAILNGLARTLRKAGRVEEAIRVYRLLETERPAQIGSLPSDLIAIHALASVQLGSDRLEGAFRLYRGLVEGRWRLAKPSYAFYAAWARDLLSETDQFQPLADEEREKLLFTRAAEQFLDQPRSLLAGDDDISFAFWRMEPRAAIVLSGRFVREHFLTGLAPALSYSIETPQGQRLAGEASPSGQWSAASLVQSGDAQLRIRVWPQDATALAAGIERRKNLYLGMLATVLALLTFGSYFTVRTLKSELAVAQMKSEFISAVSHEFRSPLAGINQLGEMLRDGRVEDEMRRREYYEMIVTETARLRRLVENILDFSRMEEGRKQYRFEPLEPSGWLRELTDDFRAQVTATGFSIETAIPAELPAIVGDREALTTAVHNLLDNAVKYSSQAKSVQVEAETDRRVLRISVRDHGVGIRAEDRPRIFEKFYRGGGELARHVKGVGLGLNLVQHIVAAHGGTIDVQTAEGEGSTFTIHLNHGPHPVS